MVNSVPLTRHHAHWKKTPCRHGWFCKRGVGCAFRHGVKKALRPEGAPRSHRADPPRNAPSTATRASAGGAPRVEEKEPVRRDVADTFPPQSGRDEDETRLPEEKQSKQMDVLVDGMNVCHYFSCGTGASVPSAKLLIAALSHCQRHGLCAHVVLPMWAFSGPRKLADVDKLRPYMDAGRVHLSPSRMDDDHFILMHASSTPGVRVLTNDNFDDHVQKRTVSQEWCAKRLVKFMFLDGVFHAML